jgi:hypothetical protein
MVVARQERVVSRQVVGGVRVGSDVAPFPDRGDDIFAPEVFSPVGLESVDAEFVEKPGSLRKPPLTTFRISEIDDVTAREPPASVRIWLAVIDLD